MPEVDLAIEGGTVVSPDGRRLANVLVNDGRVVHIGPDRASAAATVDASGLMVLPGAVDTHVHLMDPGAPERRRGEWRHHDLGAHPRPPDPDRR